MTSTPISSPQNPRFKHGLACRKRRYRREHSAFLVEGIREIEQALAGGFVLDELFLPAGSEHSKISQQAGETHLMSERLMKKLVLRDSTLEPLGIFRAVDLSQPPQLMTDKGLIVVLDGVEKPGNIGAILRTADGAGVRGVVVCGDDFDFFNPNLIRSSLGAVFRLPVGVVSQESLSPWLEEQGISQRLAAVLSEKSRPLGQISYEENCALILGSEAQGVSPTLLDAASEHIILPMLGSVDSLNVSVAAAVFYL